MRSHQSDGSYRTERLGLLALVAGLAAGCQPSDPPQDLGQAEPALRSVVQPVAAGAEDVFEDVTSSAGITFVHQLGADGIVNIMLSNGSGGAVLDYDQDGYPDLFFLNWSPREGVTTVPAGTPREPNRLYHNNGDGTFQDVTEASGLEGAGFSHAATAGDYDNDGFPDLYVVNAGRNELYHNEGDGTFKEVTDLAGVGEKGTGISAVFLDIDRDGYLDLFVANYLTYDPTVQSELNPDMYPGPLAYEPEINFLYRNRGDGTFEDVSVASGIRVPGHRGMSVSAFDADLDGDTDLYVSNDDTPNSLWLNDGQGRFEDKAMATGTALNAIGEACGSMNAAVGDANGDGLPDIFVTRLGYGSLYLRQPSGLYDDWMWASGLERLTQQYVGWGGVMVDFDNDNDQDLFIANGSAFYLDGTVPLLLENDGEAHYTDAGQVGGRFFQTPIDGRGSAVLDYDNDGRLDLLVTTLGNRPFLLRNRNPENRHWLKLDLVGTRSNRDGFGALVQLDVGREKIRSELICPTGFLVQGDRRLHFGLGSHGTVDEIRIQWPSGHLQTLQNVKADQILRVTEPATE